MRYAKHTVFKVALLASLLTGGMAASVVTGAHHAFAAGTCQQFSCDGKDPLQYHPSSAPNGAVCAGNAKKQLQPVLTFYVSGSPYVNFAYDYSAGCQTWFPEMWSADGLVQYMESTNERDINVGGTESIQAGPYTKAEGTNGHVFGYMVGLDNSNTTTTAYATGHVPDIDPNLVCDYYSDGDYSAPHYG